MKNKHLERQILIGIIVSDTFLREVKTIYQPGFIPSKGATQLIGWCLEYFEQFQKAPGLHIQDIFHSKARDGSLGAQEEQYIEDLLSTLSDEHERQDKFNSEYMLKQTEELFKTRSLSMLSEDIKADLAGGSLESAEARFNQYRPIARPKSLGINPFSNRTAVKDAFEYDTEPLFTVPGRLGQVMNPQLTRASFIALQAPEKRGKSFMLDFLARRAYIARCNVAYFDLGDMTEGQKVRRFQSSVNEGYVIGPPKKTVLYPVMDCAFNQDDSCTSIDRRSKVGLEQQEETPLLEFVIRMNEDGYKWCSLCRGNKSKFKSAPWYVLKEVDRLHWKKALRKSMQWERTTRTAQFKLSFHESNSLSIKGVNDILDRWEHFEGFIADVVILDYIDIATSDSGAKEFRHQENSKWSSFRGLTQKRNICGITVTQADSGSYGKDSQDLTNFSEDKRKYGHVTAMYSLNQTRIEKRKQLLRVGELVVREDDFDMHRQVTIMQCLALSQPYVDSY